VRERASATPSLSIFAMPHLRSFTNCYLSGGGRTAPSRARCSEHYPEQRAAVLASLPAGEEGTRRLWRVRARRGQQC